MIKNAHSLMDKANNLASQYNISTNEVLQNYMFERILERISVSRYKNNFILKGGLLLSSIMGIDTRTTMDMDTCIKGITLTDEELYKVLEEVLNIDVNDGVKFEIRNSEPIREDDDYGGLKYNLISFLDRLRVNLSIDIATGDPITPKEIEYDYKMMFEEKVLKIMTYNVETIIAEKFQTVISRGILNSRMKDYYDLYYLITYKDYSESNLKLAIEKTFKNRDTDVKSVEKELTEIEKSEFVIEQWEAYSKKHSYTNNIDFEMIIEKIRLLYDIVE